MPEVGAAVLKARYLYAFRLPRAPASGVFSTVGRVYLVPIDVLWPVVIDRIIYQVGSTSSENVRVGIYRQGATADSPLAAALVVESASVAQSSANCIQKVTIDNTLLTPGQYFVGIQGSSATGTYIVATDLEVAIAFYYDRAGGFGAFTDPCPTLTGANYVSLLILRVKENLPAGQRL